MTSTETGIRVPTATPHPQHRTATLIGCAAIATWGTLDLLTNPASAIPAFQLVAMALAIGTIPGIVNLINYLWPPLIVLFSSLLPARRPHWWHVAGGGLGMGRR